ncbi:MAG TPA: hypothetical protein VGE67_08350 [Haloferula sp.]
MNAKWSWSLLGLAALLASPEVATAGPTLSLMTPALEEAAPLGPVHVAGPGPHAISIAVRGTPGTLLSLQGELFRQLGSTVAPVAVFDWKKEAAIPSSGELIVQPEFSFGKSSVPTSYIARFSERGFPPLSIIAHPLDFLAPLKTLTQRQPLQLVGAPQGLLRVLGDAGLRVEAIEPAGIPFPDGAIVLWFSSPVSASAPPKDGRLIITDLVDLGREVWKPSANGGWTIHLCPSDLTAAHLSTTSGLVHLLELSIREPIP